MRSVRARRASFAGAIVSVLVLCVVGVAAANPSMVVARVSGTGTMTGHCVSGDSGWFVRLDAQGTMNGAHLGSGTATWTTCVDFSGNFVNEPPQTFEFSGNLGTLSGTVTNAELDHVNGNCDPTNLVGQWNVTVTVSDLSGTGKFANVSGGQLTLQYLWERQDGGVCAQTPGFAAIAMALSGKVTGSLS
jgi:hypothetical protein